MESTHQETVPLWPSTPGELARELREDIARIKNNDNSKDVYNLGYCEGLDKAARTLEVMSLAQNDSVPVDHQSESIRESIGRMVLTAPDGYNQGIVQLLDSYDLHLSWVKVTGNQIVGCIGGSFSEETPPVGKRLAEQIGGESRHSINSRGDITWTWTYTAPVSSDFTEK